MAPPMLPMMSPSWATVGDGMGHEGGEPVPVGHGHREPGGEAVDGVPGADGDLVNASPFWPAITSASPKSW